MGHLAGQMREPELPFLAATQRKRFISLLRHMPDPLPRAFSSSVSLKFLCILQHPLQAPSRAALSAPVILGGNYLSSQVSPSRQSPWRKGPGLTALSIGQAPGGLGGQGTQASEALMTAPPVHERP